MWEEFYNNIKAKMKTKENENWKDYDNLILSLYTYNGYKYWFRKFDIFVDVDPKFHSTYNEVTAKPTPPPIKHLLNPLEDLYNSPVPVPAKTVFTSSSSPRAHEKSTPKAEYITVNVPKVFAVADPCFIMWFKSCVLRSFPVCPANAVARTPL